MSSGLKSRFLQIRVPAPPTFHRGEPHLKKAEAQIERQFLGSPVTVPPSDDLQEVGRVLWAAFHDGDTRIVERPRQLRLSPWAVFGEFHPDGGALASSPRFLEWYVKLLAAKGTRRTFPNAGNAYLYNYDPNCVKLNELSEAVVAGLRSAQSFRANALLSLHEEFGVLGREGHRRVADAYGQSEMNGSAFLEELGLAGALRQSNFVYYVFAEVGKGIRHDLQKETLGVSELVRRLSLGFGSEVHASEFLFPNLLPFLADALLEPFERRDPDNPMQDAIKRFLLQQLGDIRLKPIRWNRVGAVAQSVMRRWLVETTLDGFFHLISDQVQRGESGADRQWRYRNAFWGAYLREGHITDAWVVLGWKLRQEAQSRLNLPRGSFANLESGESVRSDHAVLILRVANLVVTEWNHTAKVRVWHEGSESVPRFYKSSYYRSQMVSGADFEQRHHAAEYGTWQYQLERYIRGETGIRFSVRDLMPYD